MSYLLYLTERTFDACTIMQVRLGSSYPRSPDYQDIKEGHGKKWWGIDFKGRYFWFTIEKGLKRELGAMRDWKSNQ